MPDLLRRLPKEEGIHSRDGETHRCVSMSSSKPYRDNHLPDVEKQNKNNTRYPAQQHHNHLSPGYPTTTKNRKLTPPPPFPTKTSPPPSTPPFSASPLYNPSPFPYLWRLTPDQLALPYLKWRLTSDRRATAAASTVLPTPVTPVMTMGGSHGLTRPSRPADTRSCHAISVGR